LGGSSGDGKIGERGEIKIFGEERVRGRDLVGALIHENTT